MSQLAAQSERRHLDALVLFRLKHHLLRQIRANADEQRGQRLHAYLLLVTLRRVHIARRFDHRFLMFSSIGAQTLQHLRPQFLLVLLLLLGGFLFKFCSDI